MRLFCEGNTSANTIVQAEYYNSYGFLTLYGWYEVTELIFSAPGFRENIKKSMLPLDGGKFDG